MSQLKLRKNSALHSMFKFAITIDPSKLFNPNLDIRYDLPDLIATHSNGAMNADGYDYVGPANHLALYLTGLDADEGKRLIVKIVQAERVLENDLRDAVVCSCNDAGSWVVFFPASYDGPIYL